MQAVHFENFRHFLITSCSLEGRTTLSPLLLQMLESWAGPGNEGTQGFIQRRGGPGISPPQPQFFLPRNLEIEYISYLHVTERLVCVIKMFGNFVPDCVRSDLRGI